MDNSVDEASAGFCDNIATLHIRDVTVSWVDDKSGGSRWILRLKSRGFQLRVAPHQASMPKKSFPTKARRYPAVSLVSGRGCQCPSFPAGGKLEGGVYTQFYARVASRRLPLREWWAATGVADSATVTFKTGRHEFRGKGILSLYDTVSNRSLGSLRSGIWQ